MAATFLLALSTMDVGAKTRGFSAMIAVFLAACILLHFWQTRRNVTLEDRLNTVTGGSDIESQLLALDEGSDVFTGALKPTDTFRLVAHRVKTLVPFRSIALILLDQTRSHLTISEAEGAGIGDLNGTKINWDEGLAAQSFSSRSAKIGVEALVPNEHSFPSIAIPLIRGTEIFGVLQLYFEAAYDLGKVDSCTFEAIGTRVAPLILSSIAFERSQANALTDLTTDLPNERAFYLILENQIAEAHRKAGALPLTILTIDLKNFDEINEKYGHAAGDRALKFAAQIIKDNLRQMDFFARSMNDEFLAILPSASAEISEEVIERIERGFAGRRLEVSHTEIIEIDLNFGWASFGDDAETADELLAMARLRKRQSKCPEPPRVLWFPQDSAG